MNHAFSHASRAQILQDHLQTEELDVLVIGGGITGAGILLDAKVRGMNVGLIEMQDFGAGTSSRSTKLVHGGLRYLKQFEVGLVAEVGKERAIVYENGPHVTTPTWMLLPIIQGGTFGRVTTSLGLYVYDRLAGVKRYERRKMLGKEAVLKLEPLIRHEGLIGGGYYVEYRTDDARLTLEIVKEACERGALAVNYTKATRLLYEHGRLQGVEVIDLVSGRAYEIRARKVVNATGPWVDGLRDMDGSKRGKTLHLTKGVHIVVDGQRFPLRNAVYFDVPDGRMVFAIPRDGKTYIGTTDTNYDGPLEHPRVSDADRKYLVEAVNFMFPSLALTVSDIESSWAGLRPLIHEEGKSPSEISRRDEVFESETGLITIAGGKLTGYRKMADKVVSLVAGQLTAETGRSFPACTTDKVEISGGKFGGAAQFAQFVDDMTAEGVARGLDPRAAGRLVRRYGSNIFKVYEYLEAFDPQAEQAGLTADVYAALMYGLHHEMVVTPSDFLIRRTSAMFFDVPWVRRWREPVLSFMEDLLDWTEDLREKYATELEERLLDATTAD